MRAKNAFGSLIIAVATLAVAAPDGGATPREPLALPQVGETYAAPYDAVWEATLKSLGAVHPVVADKAAGRIETAEFSFAFVVGGSQAGNTQVLWISMRITVSRGGPDRTYVLVEPRVHDALLAGFTPGPTNNPWADLFARIRMNLGVRG